MIWDALFEQCNGVARTLGFNFIFISDSVTLGKSLWAWFPYHEKRELKLSFPGQIVGVGVYPQKERLKTRAQWILGLHCLHWNSGFPTYQLCNFGQVT